MSVENSLYIRSAALLDDDTLFNAATCKLNGIGMAKDEDEAVEIFKILAQRGCKKAMKPLADYYRKIGDEELALKWLELGSASGDISSKIDLFLRNEVRNDELENEPINYNGASTSLEAVVKNVLPHTLMIYAQSDRPGYYSTGSGFIIDGGLVITNEHVVGSNPQNVICCFEPSIDKKKYNLIPIAVSSKYDLAILIFEKEKAMELANKEHLKIRTNDLNFGEAILTVGSPFGMGLSVSHGIVSNPHCKPPFGEWPYVIQTDMSINTGNSGGALLDMHGNVVGVSTFIRDDAKGGLSFASPTSCLIEFLNEVLK